MILALIYSQLKLSTWLIKIRFVVTKDTITKLLTENIEGAQFMPGLLDASLGKNKQQNSKLSARDMA